MAHRVHGSLALILGLHSIAFAGVTEKLQEVLRDPAVQKSDVGVYVVSLGKTRADRAVVLEAGASSPLMPASNLKLVTTSAALQILGSEFKFRTVLAVRERDGKTELALIGDGDPAFGDATLAKRAGVGSVTSTFEAWADMLAAAGVRQVDDLLVDDSVFDDEFFHPSWPRDQELNYYEAEVGGLNLNANCVWFDIKPSSGTAPSVMMTPPASFVTFQNAASSGSKNAAYFTRERDTNRIVLRGECSGPLTEQKVTIHDPPMFAATTLAATLKGKGVTVGTTARGAARVDVLAGQGGWRIIATQETPLSTVLGRTNKDSMNNFAEALCKRIGFAKTGTGSWASGREAMSEYLRSLGVDLAGIAFDDGCGLSRKNRVTAGAIGHVLEDNFYSPGREAFFASLSVGGVDGTLDNRFTDDLRGRVFGKSGYINGVSSLSGYLQARDGSWHAFSILMNKVPAGTNATAKKWQERIVRTLDDAVQPRGGR